VFDWGNLKYVQSVHEKSAWKASTYKTNKVTDNFKTNLWNMGYEDLNCLRIIPNNVLGPYFIK
jgi:hypothetical protein